MYSLKSDVGCFALKILNTTSFAVISVPSENFTPFLKLKTQVFGSVVFQSVAS